MDESQAAEMLVRGAGDPWNDSAGGGDARFSQADAEVLGYAVAAVADSGVLLMLSRSQDGGALMVAFIDDGQTTKRWFPSAALAVAALEALPAHLGAPRPTPSPARRAGAPSKPRKRR